MDTLRIAAQLGSLLGVTPCCSNVCKHFSRLSTRSRRTLRRIIFNLFSNHLSWACEHLLCRSCLGGLGCSRLRGCGRVYCDCLLCCCDLPVPYSDMFLLVLLLLLILMVAVMFISVAAPAFSAYLRGFGRLYGYVAVAAWNLIVLRGGEGGGILILTELFRTETRSHFSKPP